MGFLRRLLLGPGRFPDDLRGVLLAENLLLLDEGLHGSITYRDYRAPGRRASLEKRATSGAIAVTSRRLVVWTGRSKHIDVPLRDSLRHAIQVVAETQEKVCFGYDPSLFQPATSGRVEVRLKPARAAEIVALLGG